MEIDWGAVSLWFQDLGKVAGVKILELIGLVILGFLLIKILMKILEKLFLKTKLHKVTAKFLLKAIKFSLYMLLVLAAAQILGIPMTGFIAVISAAGLALSLALQGSLSNLANGIVIISTRPFEEGDFISIGSNEGKVKEIRMLHTIITTVDNKNISIPNSKVVENEIINYNANPTRKVYFTFSISYTSDVDRAKEIITECIVNNNFVLLDPAPFVSLKTLSQSSLDITANCWCYAQNYWDVYYEITDTVFNELKRADISIPYNQLEVTIKKDADKSPYRKQPMKKRDEKIAVKPIEQHEEDPLNQLFKAITGKKIVKKSVEKPDENKQKSKKSKKAKKISETKEKEALKEDAIILRSEKAMIKDITDELAKSEPVEAEPDKKETE